MAYTDIHPIKATLGKALDYIENPEKTTLMNAIGYIENPDKTEEMMLVSGYNVDPLTASIEFTITQAMAEQIIGQRGTKKGSPALAYHLIQSFSPEDQVTPEQAHELGKRLANELLEGKYEYVIATHVDKAHVHNHIIFNATSFYDFKKFRSQPGKTASKVRAISDRICAEADLSVIKTPKQMGRAYQYKAPQYGPSWKRQILRRLKFVLEAAGSFEEFVDGAARLGVTVDASGKYITYQMEGQVRVTRDRTLDKEGAFGHQGIADQIAANTDIREQLKKDIREAAAVAGNCKEFRAELQRRGVKATETRKMGMRYSIGKDTAVREWALGPAYSTEAIQAAIRGTGAFMEAGSALDSIADEFVKTNQSHAEEVSILTGRDQILKTTADGILIAAPDEKAGADQLVFIDHNHVSYQKDTDSFKIYIGNGYDYYVATADGERTGSRMKGENIIRALELKNGVRPEYINISPMDVKSVSTRGLTISIPELGISSLFIEDRFVEYDRRSGGSVRAAIYENWSYQFQATDESAKYLAGRELIGQLKQRQIVRDGSLSAKINAMRRKSKIAETKQMAKALLLARREGVENMEDFDPRLTDLQQKQASLQASIQALQARNEEYKTVARYLVTYNTYLPVKLSAMGLSGKARRSYELTHEGELSAWSFAEQELQKRGVMAEVDPDKVLELVKEQEREAQDLRTQANKLADRAAALKDARDMILQVQERARQSDHPQRRQAQDQEL